MLPSMLWLLALIFYPILEVLRLSLSAYDTSSLTYRFTGLANFARLGRDAAFWNALQNSLIFVGVVVPVRLLIGLVLALLLNARGPLAHRLSAWLAGLWYVPWLFSTVATAMLWILIFRPFGLADGLLMHLGLIGRPQGWLGNPTVVWPAVMTTAIWQTYPFVMVMLYAGLQSIPEELYEAAAIDGANVPRQFLHITLPQLRGVLTTVVILETIWTVNAFDLLYLMTAGGPLQMTETLTLYLYRTAFQLFDFGYAAAIGLCVFALVFTFVVAYLRLAWTRGLQL